MIVISDTSPISSLIQIGELHLLKKLFNQIVIPPFVDEEVMALSKFNIDLSEYLEQDWIIIIEPKNHQQIQ